MIAHGEAKPTGWVAPLAAPTLRFQGVSMTYPDGTKALDNASLDVAPGELVTIVGPSGCGKSTLLRIAAGLQERSGGVCLVDRRSLGYVFQDATLLAWRTVAGNVGLFAELQRLPKLDRKRRVAEAIGLVGLNGHEDKYPRQLSGGMRMRTSLARSLVMKPQVFLFDEPFASLDEITRERLNDELLALFAHEGFAGLFITHSIHEAAYLSTRVLVMSARPGRIFAEYRVPFGFPRQNSLRYEPEFADFCGRISNDLRRAQP